MFGECYAIVAADCCQLQPTPKSVWREADRWFLLDRNSGRFSPVVEGLLVLVPDVDIV